MDWPLNMLFHFQSESFYKAKSCLRITPTHFAERVCCIRRRRLKASDWEISAVGLFPESDLPLRQTSPTPQKITHAPHHDRAGRSIIFQTFGKSSCLFKVQFPQIQVFAVGFFNISFLIFEDFTSRAQIWAQNLGKTKTHNHGP